MEKGVEDTEKDWNYENQKRKIELNFRNWMLARIDV
jgi:hypothetical protein